MNKENNKDEINVFTDEYIRNNKELRQEGTWVKYSAEPGNWNKEDANYHKLYNDLKDSKKEWSIANDLSACEDELCGEMIPSEGINAGDIYVFYQEENEKYVPIFYIKITNNSDLVWFNECSSFYDIDCKYLAEIILKLTEIDKNKFKKDIDDLKGRYAEYTMLLSLMEKQNLEEDEINFLYYMAYNRNEQNAINKLREIKLNEDFKRFSDEGKVKLFSHVKYDDIVNKLVIDSKEVLLKLAEQGNIKQLNNATEEIKKDKDFVIELLNTYLSQEVRVIGELMRSIPEIYQNDIDVLSCLIDKAPGASIIIGNWISQHKVNCTNKDFAYKIISAYLEVSMREKFNLLFQRELMCYALCPFSDEILKDIENHMLIGPQPSIEQEELKNANIDSMVKAKEKIFELKKHKHLRTKKSENKKS